MSYPFKKILCPVQLDDSEQVALDLASRLAKDMDATVYLMHVAPILPIDAPNVTISVHTQAADEASLRLQELPAKELAGLKSEIITRVAGPGEVARTVLEVATELDTDLYRAQDSRAERPRPFHHGQRGRADRAPGALPGADPDVHGQGAPRRTKRAFGEQSLIERR
jgi:hypothetical protein